MLFYTILILTLIWSTINSTFFAWISKNKSILGVSFYRSVFISILLLPILFFADFSKVTTSFIWVSIIIWVIGAVWFFFQLQANKYLPMGVVWALMNLNNIWVLIFSAIVLWEKLSLFGYIWATILIISLIILGWSKTDKTKNIDYKKWIFFVSLRILTLVIWISGFIYYSREVDPYFAIYLSEFTVLLWFIPFLIYYSKVQKKEEIFRIFNKKEIIKFSLMCFFPAFFSFGLFYASTIGNPSIVTLTLSTSSIFIALVWYFFYRQKIRLIQWLMIILSVIGLFIINI